MTWQDRYARKDTEHEWDSDVYPGQGPVRFGIFRLTNSSSMVEFCRACEQAAAQILNA